MTQLLILGSAILAQGPFVETEDIIETDDAIYPKHVVEGWQIVDADVPEGFSAGDYEWVEGAVTLKPPPPLTALQKQANRDAIQATINKLEFDSMLNRGSRELELVQLVDLATRKAELLQPTMSTKTVEQITAELLAATPYYGKLVALNDQISALRVELAAI